MSKRQPLWNGVKRETEWNGVKRETSNVKRVKRTRNDPRHPAKAALAQTATQDTCSILTTLDVESAACSAGRSAGGPYPKGEGADKGTFKSKDLPSFYAVFASPSQDKLSGIWGGCSFRFRSVSPLLHMGNQVSRFTFHSICFSSNHQVRVMSGNRLPYLPSTSPTPENALPSPTSLLQALAQLHW